MFNITPYGTRCYIQDLGTFNKAIATLDVTRPAFCDTEGEHLYDHSDVDVLMRRIERISKADLPQVVKDNANTSVRLVQIYQPHTHKFYLIDTDYIKLDYIKAILKQMWTVWVNAPYDFGTLNMTSYKFDDLALLYVQAFPNLLRYHKQQQKFKPKTTGADKGWMIPLNKMCEYVLEDNPYANLDKKALQGARFLKGTILTEEQLRYAEIDVIVMAGMWEYKVIQDVRDRDFYKLDMKNLRHSINYQQNKILVDRPAVHKLIEQHQIDSDLVRGYFENLGINPNSPKQVKEWFLTNRFDLHSTGKDILNGLKDTCEDYVTEFIDKLLIAKGAGKKLSALKNLDYDFVRTKYNPYGTVTGRFSASGDNVLAGINGQNVDRKLLHVLEADTEDTIIVHADYGTAELRTACSIMREPVMRTYLIDKVDLHKVSAMLADTLIQSIEDVTKEQRQKGKAISFGFIFGMGWLKFVGVAKNKYNVIFTEAEAIAVKKAYEATYPTATMWRRNVWDTYKTTPMKTPLGRQVLSLVGNEAINFGTQGGIGETIKIAIDKFVDYNELTREYNNDYINFIILQIHDALISRFPKERMVECTYFKIKAMLDAWDELCKSDLMYYKDIPMEVEFEYLHSTDTYTAGVWSSRTIPTYSKYTTIIVSVNNKDTKYNTEELLKWYNVELPKYPKSTDITISISNSVVVYTVEELQEWARTVKVLKEGVEVLQDYSKLYPEVLEDKGIK